MGDKQEFGRTPTIYNTVHPVWKACTFELPLEAPKRANKLEAQGEEFSSRGGVGGDGGFAGGEEEIEAPNIELTVQVWDEDDGKAVDFLGELKFGAAALLEMAREGKKLVS